MASISNSKAEVISQLKKDILLWQGYKPTSNHIHKMGLGSLEKAFPNAVFPIGSIHEYVCTSAEQLAATGGFIAGLLASLMHKGGVCLWIHTSGTIFPPALKAFGMDPGRIVFMHLKREQDVLWAMEEALKCVGIAAVIAELSTMDFTQSRRFQLAVEKSRVTGFVLRRKPLQVGSTACAARWQIKPLPSQLEAGMPGIGFPRWRIDLLKVRNGHPGTWDIEWRADRFVQVPRSSETKVTSVSNRKVG